MALLTGSVPKGFGHENATLIPLPPQNGGAIGWGTVYLSFGTDFSDALLRIAVWNDNVNEWRISELSVPARAGRILLTVQDGDSKVSVYRISDDPNDRGDNPVSWLLETTLRAV